MQLGGREVLFLEQARDAGHDRFARIVRRRQQLAGVDEIAPRIVQHEIRKRAADVDADADGAFAHCYFVPYAARAAAGVMYSSRRSASTAAGSRVFGFSVPAAARIDHAQPRAGCDRGAGFRMRRVPSPNSISAGAPEAPPSTPSAG